MGGMAGGERGTNILDTGAHYYETYETRDGLYISLGSIEPQFYAELIEKLGLDPKTLPSAERPLEMARDEAALRG